MTLTRTRPRRGAALLTALFVVAIAGGVAAMIMETVSYATKRTGNVVVRDQARWIGFGGEAFVRALIEREYERNSALTTLDAPWEQGPAQFAVGLGALEGRVRDVSNCFNLNSVVRPVEEGYRAREEGMVEYTALLNALDIAPGNRADLVDALVDWIDTDQAPQPQGAEDFAYVSRSPPYRTGATLMAEVTELRAVQGYNEAIYAELLPFVCAHPDTALAPVNINTLRPNQWPLLVMLSGGEMREDQALALIDQRPAGGYQSVEELQEALPSGLLDEGMRLPKLKSTYFDVEIRVVQGQRFFAMTSRLEQSQAGDVRVVFRRFGLNS